MAKGDLNDKRILIVRLSSFGDVIVTLPVARAIKATYPRAHVAWLIQSGLQDMLKHNPYVDEVIPVDLLSVTDKYATPLTWIRGSVRLVQNLVRTSRLFRERPFDVVFDFQALFKSGIFAYLNRGAARYGFKNARECSRVFLNHPIFVRDKSRHAVYNFLDFAAHFGCETEPVEFPIYVSQEDRNHVDRLLQSEGVGDDDFTVFFSATARWESKYWDQSSFATVADKLVERYNAKPIFSGLPSEEPYLRQITELMHEKGIVLAGKTTIPQFFALMQRCGLFVGIDGGAMHTAAAMGIPVVALFGPAITSWIGPFGQEEGIITLNLPCAPCNKKRCADRRCMTGITPQMVLDRVAKILTNH
jgi:ADP-heptose:LPS heptosyltransferase